MAKPRTYPRVEHEGKEYLQLLNEDTLGQLNVEWALTATDIRNFYKRYTEYVRAAQAWFYVETGYELVLIPHETNGFVWAVEAGGDMSTRYVWLQRKAKKFHRYIVERLNAYGRSVDEALKHINSAIGAEGEEESDEGHELGEDSGEG